MPDANLIATAMPFPVARAYKSMLNEGEPRVQFQRTLGVFASLLKYVSILAIVDYFRDPVSQEINNDISQNLRRPTLGQWLGFFRRITQYYRRARRPFHVVELVASLDKHADAILNRANSVRNNVYAHTEQRYPSVEEARKDQHEAIPQLQWLFTHFDFLTRYPLVLRDTTTQHDEPLMGALAPVVSKSAAYRVIILNDQRVELDLSPFLIVAPDAQDPAILLYERLHFPVAHYSGRLVRTDSTPGNPVSALDRQLRTISVARDLANEDGSLLRHPASAADHLDVHLLAQVAHLHSESVFQEYQQQGGYDHRTYVHRHELSDAYNELLTTDRNLLVLTGDSGVGKSTEVCRLYASDLRNDIVWLLSGRRVQAHSLFASLLGYTPQADSVEHALHSLLAAFDSARHEERFVIILDGLNEADQPDFAFTTILTLLGANPYPWLKIIITCRTLAWSVIEASGVAVDRRKVVLGSETAIAHQLTPFDDREASEAISRYSDVFGSSLDPALAQNLRDDKVLRLPLVLRFLFLNHRGQRIPTDVNLGTVVHSFLQQRLQAVDHEFLLGCLLPWLYHHGVDVLDTDLLTAEVAADPTAASQKLVEAISAEPTDVTEEVLLCSNKDCEFFSRPSLADGFEEQGRCHACHAALRVRNVDNRSSYARLLDEGILQELALQDRIVVRFVFDRYFDYFLTTFVETSLMDDGHEDELIPILLLKANEHSAYLAALRAVTSIALEKGATSAICFLSTAPGEIPYFALREVLLERLQSGLDAAETLFRNLLLKTNSSESLCRAAVWATLQPSVSASGGRIIDILLLLTESGSERVQEHIGESLIELRHRGTDLLVPIIRGTTVRLLASVAIFDAIHMWLSMRRRKTFVATATLFLNAMLSGLGTFGEDDELWATVNQCGLQLIHAVLEHPLLRLLEWPLCRFIAREITSIYFAKGPLPCNYWEILFQLSLGRTQIQDAGRLFDLGNGNIFDLPYDEFHSKLQSHNGLVTWYLLSALPLHYMNSRNKERAASYLKAMVNEPDEMESYVGAMTVAVLWRKHVNDVVLKSIMEDIGKIIASNIRRMFLHPPPVSGFRQCDSTAKYMASRINDIRSGTARANTNPFAIPWFQLTNGEIRRFYINSSVLHYEMFVMQTRGGAYFSDVLELLSANEAGDIVGFGEELTQQRRFVISFTIQALAQAAVQGYLPEVFATLRIIIHKCVDTGRDSIYYEAYEFSVVRTLQIIRRRYPREVAAFIASFDVARAQYAFLRGAKDADMERERLFNRSVYGGNIYRGAFLRNPLLCQTFGALTAQAAEARDVEEFFLIYTRGFVAWFRTLS